jgi:hypothetical protein
MRSVSFRVHLSRSNFTGGLAYAYACLARPRDGRDIQTSNYSTYPILHLHTPNTVLTGLGGRDKPSVAARER